MKIGIPAVVAMTMLVSGFAQAQTSPSTTSPSTTTTPNTSAPSITAPSTGVNGANSALGAVNPGRVGTTTAPAAVSTTSAPSRTTAAPVAGANSFTESEARRRIEEKGFGQVAGLKKDDKGIWRGTATKDGHSMAVALDYQGNIVSQ